MELLFLSKDFIEPVCMHWGLITMRGGNPIFLGMSVRAEKMYLDLCPDGTWIDW
jgi:hypothetical protein